MGTFDLLDSVTVKVESNIHATQTKTLYQVSGVAMQSFSFPLTESIQYFDITVDIKEGSQTRRLILEADYGFSEAALAAGGWLRGTFPDRQKSVDYHFDKHHTDRYVRVSNVEDYLDQAAAFHYKVIEDDENGNLSYYNLAYKPTSVKLTSRTNYRYGTFTLDLSGMYSYGGD